MRGDYIVYIFRNPKTDIPFLVGSGSLARSKNFHARHSSILEYIEKNGKPNVEIFASGLSKNESEKIEKALTLNYGKLIDGTGTLLNIKTVNSGLTHSKKTKDLIKEKRKNQKFSKESREKMSESAFNVWREKKAKGFKVSESTKAKMSNNMKGKHAGKIFITNGKITKRVHKDTLLEVGWYRGRTLRVYKE